MTDDWQRSNYNTALDAMRRNEGAFDPAEKAQDYIARKRYRAQPSSLSRLVWVMIAALFAGLVISAWRAF